MNLAVIKETKIGERRVALVPQHIKKLIEKGHQVFVEENAGLASGFTDGDYQEAGAEIVNTEKVYQQPIIVRVKEPPIETLQNNQIIISYLHIEKNQNPTLLNALLEKNITAYALEEIRDSATKHRLVSLGFEAGIVGMFEGLRNYGKILEQQNQNNIFKNVKSMKDYPTKSEAYLALREINPRHFTAKLCRSQQDKL